MEVLSVRQSYGPNTPNNDAEFLGIFQSEAEMLREMDPEDLKNFHIVPVQPAITTTKRKAAEFTLPSKILHVSKDPHVGLKSLKKMITLSFQICDKLPYIAQKIHSSTIRRGLRNIA